MPSPPLHANISLFTRKEHTKNDMSPTAPINTCTDKKQPPKNHKLSRTPTMSKDLLPTSPGADAPPGTHSLPTLLDENDGPAPGQKQVQPQLTHGIKTMHLRLPHPCSLETCFPLPLTNGVQPPIQSRAKSLVSSILQSHTNTFIFIKTVSFTPRRSPPAPPR